MNVLVVDPAACDALMEQRRRSGSDHRDEVWEGVYVMNPLASNSHQQLVYALTRILGEVIVDTQLGTVLPGANVASEENNWERDYRCPDVVVVLKSGRARYIGAAWVGGPDFLVEIRSPGENSAAKLPFYGRIGVRDLLVVDRDTKDAELFRLEGAELKLICQATPTNSATLVSQVVPLSFAKGSQSDGQQLIVRRTDRSSVEWRL